MALMQMEKSNLRVSTTQKTSCKECFNKDEDRNISHWGAITGKGIQLVNILSQKDQHLLA